MIWSLTSVPPERMKILGLIKGKLPPEEVEVCTFLVEGKTKEFMMVRVTLEPRVAAR